ncbi:chloride channel [Lactarius indigo]|nr:chloride channel [Lactarius indigo]
MESSRVLCWSGGYVSLVSQLPKDFFVAGDVYHDWRPWGEYLGISSIFGQSLLHSFAYILLSTAFAASAAVLVSSYASYAFHTGIPEIKAMFGGYVFDSFLSSWTLLIKALGLALSVSSGLSFGKEGPLVHVSCCMSFLFMKLFSKFHRNEARKRKILAAAAAAGVSVAFGSPLGGVLFGLEGTTDAFGGDFDVMWRGFVTSVIAAVALQYVDPYKTSKLVLFQPDYHVGECISTDINWSSEDRFHCMDNNNEEIQVPAGIFLPTIAIGAAFGRVVGLLAQGLYRAYPKAWFFSACPPDPTIRCIYPGFYAVIGASSMVAGVTRMTVSLVVIVFELTGALSGGPMTPADKLVVLRKGSPLGELKRVLDTWKYHGFPVVRDGILLGYVAREMLKGFIEPLLSESGAATRIGSFTDAMQLRKEVSLELVVNMFRKLNLRHIMFAQAGKLTGMITKTDIVALSTAHFVHRGALAEERNTSGK